MLHTEFEELTGLKNVSEEEYLYANGIYENWHDVDKKEFCKEYMKVRNSKLVRDMNYENILLRQKSKSAEMSIEWLVGELIRAVNESDYQLDEKLLKTIVGARTLILKKVSLNAPLSIAEQAYLQENLK